jgi:cell wall-associated NlpC family hydrolase
MTLPRILAIMGSGETAPTMVTTHRKLTSLLPQPVQAVVLDTPYGFQENAPELASRAQDYFRTSINVEIEIAGLVRLHDTHIAADPVQIERGLRRVANANYIFAGPGSPTYALRQWSGSPIASIITGKLQTGGIVTFASAAALTLGKATVPVYEVYKVGQDVERLDGLDILSSIGINAAVIPHYDNAEGGNHDTRFCYLGEKRLELFETMLDNDTYVLGVDEHTGLVIDIDAQEATVVGNGGVTLRLRSQSFVYPTGSVLPFSLLQNPFQLLDPGSSATSNKTARIASTESPVQDAPTTSAPSSLEQSLQQASQEFEEAMKDRNAEGAVRAALALEQAMVDWKADTLQGDVTDRCRATLRSMMSQLGDAAVSGVRDPREVVSPYIEAMLAVRAIVRAEKRFDLSDIIRDAFASLNIEVRDTPQGAEWSLPTE